MRSGSPRKCAGSHQRTARHAAARLGNAALRPLLAAPGPGLGTPVNALRTAARRMRRAVGTNGHRAAPAGAAVVPRLAHLLLPQGPTPRRRRAARAADAGRLRARVAGGQVPANTRVRGGLLDLYPMGSALPYRLDLFGDEIESIRTFDPDSQRSLYPIERVRLLPGREFPIDEAARSAFRSRWRERFEGDPSRSTVYRDVGNGIAPAGIEYWLPLFHDQTATLFDYLPAGAIVVSHGDVEDAARRFADEATQRFRFLSHDAGRPLLRPDELFIESERFFVEARRFGRWSIARPEAGTAHEKSRFSVALPDVAVNRRAGNPVERLETFLQGSTVRTLIVAESPGRRETLSQLLAEHGLPMPAVDDWPGFAAGDMPAALAVGPLHDGFALPDADIAVVTEAELFVGTVRRTRRGLRESQTDIDSIIRDLSELKIGDPVVHAQHGIGRYEGLLTMDLGDGPTEFLHLTYANQAALYVPVAQLHVIGRYSGASPEDAPLHQLGSDQWDKARTRAAAARARRRRGTAQSLRAPCRAHRACVRLRRARLRGVRRRIPVRGDARPAGGDPRGDPGHGVRQADGPAGVRRRRLRQDRGGAARRLCRDRRRQAGRDPHPDHAAGRAALPHLFGPLRRPAGEAGGTVAFPLAEGDQGGDRRHQRRTRRHRDRHAQAAVARGHVSAPRPGHHRRGAPLRRAPEGGAEGAARRGRRADADRHADPAHAGDEPGGHPRLLGDRHRAAKAAGDQDLRAPRVRQRDPRGTAARIEARRPGLFPAQRGRHDRPSARPAGRTGPRGAHRDRARPDARARARARDARLPPAALQRAAVHHDHRDRHRRAEREHHRDQPRRPLRPGAAAPAARPRRPLASPGLRLPADPRRGGDHPRRRQAARGDPDDGGARLGVLSCDARSRDPRRRRGARRIAVRRHAGGRLRAVHRDARRSGALAQGGPRTRPVGAVGGDHRDQAARAGVAAGRLLPATCTNG